MNTITIEKQIKRLSTNNFDSESSLFLSLWEAYQGTKVFDDLLDKRYDFRPMKGDEVSSKFLKSVVKTKKINKNLLHNI